MRNFQMFLLLLLSQQIPIVEAKSYKLYSSDEIHVLLEEWKVQYPDLIRLTDAQEAFGLPSAGSPYDCPFDERNGCPNAIMTIQDYVRHPVGSKSSNALPEVLWSGCVHGNERVGPTAVMETAGLLLEAATCEYVLSKESNDISCRAKLAESGIDDVQRRWLARLVSTRRIVVIPTANALGYHRNARTEDGIDPNRDFPYDLYNPSLCMRTIAGRTLNEIFREHQFQMALTFHGGVEVVAYEWGAPSWYGSLSPDDESQNQIAAAYSKYGGTWDGTRPYEYGTMNDMVYYVRGGMEDWAYAGSWDTDRVLACQPTTYGGYPSDKTKYNNSTLRAFNMLIETSNEKNPYYNLGSSEDLLNEKSTGSGHISRNIRLSLLSADLVEPYVTIVQVNDILLQRDVVPLTWSADCGGSITVDGNSTGITNNNQLTITFSVGGALTIDQVDLWYANKKDSGAIGDCFKQPTMASLQAFAKATMVGRTRGTGRFSNSGPTPSSSDGLSAGPLFVGVLDIPPNTGGSSEWVVMASARVDQDWSMVPNNAGAPTNHVQQPQSHMANVRTNPNWRHESDDGKLIQGRLDWFSQPLTVVVPPNNIPTTPVPTDAPTKSPTLLPSISVSKLSSTSKPTGIPTDAPSIRASSSPSLRPNSSGTTREPTISPTTTPSIPPVAMTSSPSELETQEPTLVPSWNGDGDQNDDDDDGGLLSSSEPSSTSTSQTPTFSPSHSSDISNSPSQLPTARGNIRSSSSDPTNDVLFNATLLPSLSPAIPPSNDASSARQSLLFRSHAIVGMILVSSLVQTLI